MFLSPVNKQVKCWHTLLNYRSEQLPVLVKENAHVHSTECKADYCGKVDARCWPLMKTDGNFCHSVAMTVNAIISDAVLHFCMFVHSKYIHSNQDKLLSDQLDCG